RQLEIRGLFLCRITGTHAIFGITALTTRHALDVHQRPLLDPLRLQELRRTPADVRSEPRGGQRDRSVLVVRHTPPMHRPEVLGQAQRLNTMIRRFHPARRGDHRVLARSVDLPGLSSPPVQLARPPVDLKAAHVRARPLTLLDEPLMAQRLQRPRGSRTGHVPARGQLPLRGNLVPRPQVTPKNLITDVVRDLEILRLSLLDLWHAFSSPSCGPVAMASSHYRVSGQPPTP